MEISENAGFFFQGNSVLLPPGLSNSGDTNEIDLDYREFFVNASGNNANIDTFDIPSLTDSKIIHVIDIPPETGLPPGWRAIPVRDRLQTLSIEMAEGTGHTGRLLRAFHIAQWRAESRFCGSCGHVNTDSSVEVARQCPACGRLEYPRIAPAVIVLITNDTDQILLAHNAKFASGMYSLIAGFNEAGETLEATVHREIREEVNIEVSDIKFIVSQPWPFPNSLMLGYSARHCGGEIRADHAEIDDARWWDRNSLPQLPRGGSVARLLINRWLDGTLPVNQV